MSSAKTNLQPKRKEGSILAAEKTLTVSILSLPFPIQQFVCFAHQKAERKRPTKRAKKEAFRWRERERETINYADKCPVSRERTDRVKEET